MQLRHRHIARAAAVPRPSELRTLWREAHEAGHSFNGKVAVVITAVLGSMPFFWFSCGLALLSLPAVLLNFDNEVLHSGTLSWVPSALTKASLVALVAWVAQTFIQLVALSVLQVSNNAQIALQEEHVAEILDRLDTDTTGGLQVVLARIDKLQEVLVRPKGS